MELLFIISYFCIMLLVIEINTILITLTGLDREIARFQVISMLTGTGFTTIESELIIEHPVRRKIGTFLILFGAFSLAVVISYISTLLSNNLNTEVSIYGALILLMILIVLKLPLVKDKLSILLHEELEKHHLLHEWPAHDVLQLNENEEIFELSITEDSALSGKKADFILKQQIHLLYIQRNKTIRRSNFSAFPLQTGDLIYIYGEKKTIETVFKGEAISNRKTIDNKKSTP